MPWLEPQVRALRALGVHWAMRAEVSEVVQPQLPMQPAEPAGPLAARERPSHGLEVDAANVPAPAAQASGVPLEVSCDVPTDVPVQTAPASPSVPLLGWDELRAAVAACEACALCRTRTQTVFGVGSTQAQWMVVGEAPGEQEDLRGEPFVGAAGRLLDQMLAALGLSREQAAQPSAELARRQVYIANTLKCRPPGNRNPQPEELARCEPFLQRQLQLLQPRIILAMGRFAVQSLLRSSEPVGKLRGRVHRYRGVPLVVTYHPAYLLRNPLDKARAWEDLCLAAATFEAGATTGTSPNSPN